MSHALQVTNIKPQQTHQSLLEKTSNELFTVCTCTVCMQDGEWTSSTVCWSSVSGLEVFIRKDNKSKHTKQRKKLPTQTKGECAEDTGSTVDGTVGATAPISAPPVMTRQLPPDTPAV